MRKVPVQRMWRRQYETRRSKHLKYLLFISMLTCVIVVSERYSGHGGLQKKRIFLPTHHKHKIFPSDARLIDVVNLPYVIANFNLCLKVQHVIIVHSAVGNYDRRNAFRDTWANPDVLHSLQAKLVFIVGQPRDDLVQRDLLKENYLNHDIIQGNFIDSYRNLTLKAVTGMRWVAENCIDARTVFKIDDDVFLNIYKAIFETVPLLSLQPRQVICTAEANAYIFRQSHSKVWKVSDRYFPGLKRYPMPFCYGFAVFMSLEVAFALFEVSKKTPFYNLDDVFMYGIVANKVEGLTWLSEDFLFTRDPNLTLSVFREQDPDGLLVGTVRSRNASLELWELTKQLHFCNKTVTYYGFNTRC